MRHRMARACLLLFLCWSWRCRRRRDCCRLRGCFPGLFRPATPIEFQYLPLRRARGAALHVALRGASGLSVRLQIISAVAAFDSYRRHFSVFALFDDPGLCFRIRDGRGGSIAFFKLFELRRSFYRFLLRGRALRQCKCSKTGRNEEARFGRAHGDFSKAEIWSE